MEKRIIRILSIMALVLIVISGVVSCGENAKQEKVVADETKGSEAASVLDSVKTETLNEPVKVDQSFIWPAAEFDEALIENGFGFYKDPVFGKDQFHQGVDIKSNLGDKVLASTDGKIVKAEWYGGYGQCVIIEHKDGIQTLYGHLDEILAKKDALVNKGDVIGLVGSTGISIKPHIQFEIRVKDEYGEYKAIDPAEFMKKQNSDTGNR